MKKIFLTLIIIFFAQNTFAQILPDNRIELSFYTNDNNVKEHYLVFAINIEQYDAWARGIVTRGILKIQHKSAILPSGRELLSRVMAQEIPIIYQCQECVPQIISLELKGDKLLVETDMTGPDKLIIFQWEQDHFEQIALVKRPKPSVGWPNNF